MSRLTIFRDDAFLEEHVLMRAIVALGRHPENDIVLDDRTLSRFHARLERRGDRYVVIDLGAQNGIYLNGNKITGECDLVPGDRIGMGRYVAIFDQDNASPSRRRGERREPAPARAIPSADAAPTMQGQRYSARAMERVADGFDRASGKTDPHDDDDDSFEGPTTAVEKRAAVPTLVLLYNGLEVSRHLVGASKPLIIGRSKGSDVVISLLGLSRRHSKVTLEDGAVVVRDLGSQNGTWVNNARIEGARTLQHGDLLNFYEYGILYLDDPEVELGEGTGFPQQVEGDDALAARETGRQDPPSIQTKPLISSKPKKRAPEPTRRSLRSALSDRDDEGGQASDLDALDLGEGSYLGEEFDDLSEDFESSLAGQQPLDDGTDVVKAYQPDDDDSDGDFGTETSRTVAREDDFASASQTSTVRGKQGAKRDKQTAANARAAWPDDVELDDALSQPGADRLASLEIYLGERLFTQVPLSNPVTRIGADPRCELALPPRAKLRPWHITLVSFSGATLCVRGSKKGRVRIDGSDIDQTVLRDGDSIDLGHVRVVYRCR